MIRIHVFPCLIALALSFPTPATAQGAMTCNDHSTLSSCTRHEPEAFGTLGVEFFKGMCELANGRWETDPCPTAAAVGTCDDKMGSVTTYYSTGGLPYDAKSAGLGCSQAGGTFAAVGEAPLAPTPTPPPPPDSEVAPNPAVPSSTAQSQCQKYEACCMAWADSMSVIDGYPQSSIETMREACTSIRSMEGLPGAEASCEIALDAMRQGAAGMTAYPNWEIPQECL